MDMSITVRWNAAQEANVTRREMDEGAVRSHARAVAAIDGGRFADEIVPVSVQRRDGSTTSFDTDEHQRRDSTLGTLKPLHPDIEGFSVTGWQLERHQRRSSRDHPHLGRPGRGEGTDAARAHTSLERVVSIRLERVSVPRS